MPTEDGSVKIGVLAIQGSVEEHLKMLEICGAVGGEVLDPKDLEDIDGLIIPGGESTTISKLMATNGLASAICEKAKLGLPIYGTCAGMILLSKSSGGEMQSLGLMDVEVERNAYGRQVNSFQTDVDIDGIGEFPAVFIRAPRIKSLGENVKILAKHNQTPIMCRQGNLLVSSFHPELTTDTRVHNYFIEMCK